MRGRLWYRIFGMRIRAQACACAAAALAGRPEEDLVPQVWSLTVFFETYMLGGCEATREDFGPKEPVPLRAVRPD